MNREIINSKVNYISEKVNDKKEFDKRMKEVSEDDCVTPTEYSIIYEEAMLKYQIKHIDLDE